MKDEYVRKAKVLRVVDADTLDLLVDLGYAVYVKERVRLARVDAWETRGEEREKGLMAKAFVESLLEAADHEVTVRTTKHKGKYGRYIAEIEVQLELDTVNLSDKLLEGGHGRRYEP